MIFSHGMSYTIQELTNIDVRKFSLSKLMKTKFADKKPAQLIANNTC